MKNENINTLFSLKLYHTERDGEIVYRMVEYNNTQIVKEFESEKIKNCLEHFKLPSDDEYIVYWMFNSEEMGMRKKETVSNQY